MRPVVQELVERISSDDIRARDAAVSSAAFILERTAVGPTHGWGEAEATFYEDQLAPELLNLELSREEQKALVRVLGRRAVEPTHDVSAVWALSKALPEIAAEEVVSLVSRADDDASNDWVFQVLVAFLNCLPYDAATDSPAASEQFDRAAKTVARLASVEDSRISTLARQVLARLS